MTFNISDQEKVSMALRIEHIKSHLDGGFNIDLLVNLTRSEGIFGPRLLRLSSHAFASAMFSWFETHDLALLRQWFYVSAKLERLWYLTDPDTMSPGAKFLSLMQPLISNEENLIDWYINHEKNYDSKRIENTKTHDFHAYQAIVALKGDWTRLIDRCERVLSYPPKSSSEQKYLIDHQFYLALANGDTDGMKAALAEITSSKSMRARANNETGYTQGLISTPAVIMTKIAWRAGYQIQVDSAYVPPEWLPLDPLPDYDDHYDFLN